ncbi:class I SAM-dependent methyltransferase [Fastidiosibacter lacustris]|uniref:class I SAM-dependent methyltransferase n=1 Tax=Fastidiosibacter lacustris TaxID=2056695 RepID=UPI000E34AD41|nr:SAM-dependent methyltransferase [Fastidiosibacter lacustris]
MHKTKITLPALTHEEQQRVNGLSAYITNLIEHNDGQISFKQFMQQALYAPGLGYYTANKEKLGEKGDFITAPMTSRLFGQTFALQFADILKTLGDETVIIEFGAGTGQFALDCLDKLHKLNALPKSYYIIEPSPTLKIQQQRLLQQLGEYYQHIFWLSALPKEKLSAIVFANEVLDAMPVELFRFNNHCYMQMMVTYENNQFAWCENIQIDEHLAKALQALPLTNYALNDIIYQSEINLWIEPWLASVQSVLKQGVVFICDYGYQRPLYYNEARTIGTLQCYYKHHVHDNPLIYVGVQDITAHVDFTALAEAAQRLGFELDGFSTQGAFLSSAGILSCYQSEIKRLKQVEALALTQQLNQLTLGTDLAENFKVMTLSYHYDHVIDAFDHIDLSYLL